MEKKPVGLPCIGTPFKKRKQHRPADDSQHVSEVPKPVVSAEPQDNGRNEVRGDHGNGHVALEQPGAFEAVKNGAEDQLLFSPVPEADSSKDFRCADGGARVFDGGAPELPQAKQPQEATPPAISPASDEDRHHSKRRHSRKHKLRMSSKGTRRAPSYSEAEIHGVILYNFERGLTAEACFEQMNTILGPVRAPSLTLVRHCYAEFNSQYHKKPEESDTSSEAKKRRKSKRSKKSNKHRDEEGEIVGHKHRHEQQVRSSPRLSAGRYAGGSDEAGPSHQYVVQQQSERHKDGSSEARKVRKEPADSKHAHGKKNHAAITKKNRPDGARSSRKRSRRETSESSNAEHNLDEGSRRKRFKGKSKNNKHVEERVDSSDDDDFDDNTQLSQSQKADDLEDVD